MTDEKKEKSELVKHVDRKLCGCSITEYSDGRKEIAPCVPCGLFTVSQNLAGAAEALAATATTLRKAGEQATLAAAVTNLRRVP